jgi:hypothetical protein
MDSTRPDRRKIDRWTVELVEAAARGRTTIYQVGQEVPMKLTAPQLRAFDLAKMHGYAAVPRGRSNVALSNCWYRYCEATDHPYVTISFGRSLCKVDMDLIAQRWILPDEAVDRLFEQTRRLIDHPRARFWRGGMIFNASHVRIDLADALARAFVEAAIACRPPDGTMCTACGCTNARTLVRVADGWQCTSHSRGAAVGGRQ